MKHIPLRQAARNLPPVYDRAALKMTPEEREADRAAAKALRDEERVAAKGEKNAADAKPKAAKK